MLCVIGSGTLGKTLANKCAASVFDRSHWDLMQDPSDDFISKLKKFDVIILCAATYHDEPIDIMKVNFMAPINLIMKLITCGYHGKLILVGSHAASWTCWPGIDIARLAYNQSKKNLREFVKAVAHSGLTPMQLCVFEPTKFASNMNQWQGKEVDHVADTLLAIAKIDSILHVEMSR